MSEYQYYEFVAIDRPLTREEMAALRSRSSRAAITPTSFVNEYNWGDLKGDPADWMRRYFDAFIYVANWCSCRLALRVPHSVFRKAELIQYATEENALTVDDAGSHWIIDWSLNESEDYERFEIEDGRGWMGRLVPLRDELLRGDLRPLYLGWLAGVTSGEVDDEAMEPEVPSDMSQLSASQQALAEFLEIDPDLLAAAAAGSTVIAESSADAEAGINAWLTQQSADDMRTVLKLLLQGQSQQAERQIKSRFLSWQKEHVQSAISSGKRRRVSELWEIAAEAEKGRLQHEAEERARQAARERKKREAYLATLAVDFDRCWNAIHQQAERGIASAYDEAKRAIVDLADAYALVSKRDAFDLALRGFMERHGKRSALVRRLVDAGLWKK